MARKRNNDSKGKKRGREWTWANAPHIALDIITSYGLAATVLLLLTVITLFGTLNQVEESLYDSQKKYFESFWISDTVGKIPIFLPGGYLLMAILFSNMLAGTILKIRKNWKAVGLYVSHVGILMLIVSSFVTKHFAWEGNMALYPGMTADEALSYHYWQLEIIPIAEDGTASEALVIPHGELRPIGPRGTRTFGSEELPFDLVVDGYYRNSLPVPASAPVAQESKARQVGGFVLIPQPLEKEAEANMAGLYARIEPRDGSSITKGDPETIIWAHLGGNFAERIPYTVSVDDKDYAIQLVRERMKVPFDVQLDEFIFEKYAGISTARNYQSNITKIEGDSEEEIEIKMNEPLRHRGYTFFQASFGPANAGPTEELYSVFAIVKNPSDHWPLYSLIVVGTGLLTHLLLKLSEHLKRNTRTA